MKKNDTGTPYNTSCNCSVITGLLCLSPLAIHTSSVGPSWHHGRPVVSCVFLSIVVLDKDLLCSFVVISVCFKPSVAHNLAYFTLTPSQFIIFKVYPLPLASPITTHSEARLIQLSQSKPWLQKKLSKMVRNFAAGFLYSG